MANDNVEFEELLRASLQGLALQKGPCPSVEQIIQYQGHENSPEAESEIHSHLLACGHCEALLLRIERFSAAVATPRSRWRTMLRFLGRPALGYALAALLLLALVTGVGQKRTVAPLPRPAVVAEALPSFELAQTRGEGDVVLRPGGSESFILRFFVPMNAGRRYVARISDRTRREVIGEVEVRNSDGRGNVDMVCRTAAFAPGSYLLTVLEKGSEQPVRYSFQVR